MEFTQAVICGFNNYTKTNGRASRSEFWNWWLFISLGAESANIADGLIAHANNTIHSSHPIYLIFSCAILLPSLAIWMRRLHDVNRTEKWVWIAFTVIGSLVLLIWFCKKGTVGDNRFGSDPLTDVQQTWVDSLPISAALFLIISSILEVEYLRYPNGALFILCVGWLMIACIGFRSIRGGKISIGGG